VMSQDIGDNQGLSVTAVAGSPLLCGGQVSERRAVDAEEWFNGRCHRAFAGDKRTLSFGPRLSCDRMSRGQRLFRRRRRHLNAQRAGKSVD
jgi:hypothetical protein